MTFFYLRLRLDPIHDSLHGAGPVESRLRDLSAMAVHRLFDEQRVCAQFVTDLLRSILLRHTAVVLPAEENSAQGAYDDILHLRHLGENFRDS